MSRALTGPSPGIILCVGVSPEDFAEVARALSGRATLVTAPDTMCGRTALLNAAGLASTPVGILEAVPQAPADFGHHQIVHGPLTIDVVRREVTWQDQVIPLPARSFDLLATLAEDPGRTWNFADLTLRVWQRDYLGDTDAVISAVKRLRGHIAGYAPQLQVESVRGIGFRLVGVHAASAAS